jgi:hypothetical protein
MSDKFRKGKWLIILIALALLVFPLLSYGVLAGTNVPVAEFKVSNLVLPAEVGSGDNITISATVSNVSAYDGSYESTLIINGVKETSAVVSVQPNSSASVQFTVSRTEAGTYEVDVDGLTGSFTVLEKSSASGAGGLSMGLLIGIVAAALVIIFILWMFISRRFSLTRKN